MITLSFPWLVALVVLLFLATLVLLACFKSPMRKWVCFGLSTVSVAYLLYILVFQQDNAQKLEWYLFVLVGIIASLMLAGVGFMDMVKPKSIIMPVQNSDIIAVLSPEEDEKTDDVNGKENDEDAGNENEEEKEDDDNGENGAEKIQREELIGKVLPWFLDQLVKYDEEEQNTIKVCAIEFVNDGTIPTPDIEITKGVLSQKQLMELCSAFILLDKDRSECAEFAKTVFANTFNNTEISTLEKKIKGKGTMQITIDSYWDAQDITL